jgi:diacylglycerol O-acyltransferase / wax synthase
MQNHRQSDRLSWGDTVFLHLEREGMPLNVASICMLEGEVSFEDCLQFVESKLPLLPRYLKRVVAPPLNIGLPSWEYDPNFDVRNHVREVRLKHGTDTELKALAGRLFSEVMDRRRPLWDITLVRGLNGNRTALILRLHHCLADGIAGVGILNAMLDASPEAPPLPKKKIRFQVPPPPDAINSLMDGVVSSYSDFVKRILSAWADLLDMTERMAANGGNLATEEFSRFFPEITAFTERLRFNVPYRGPQKFAYTEISLADVKAIRHKCGTSVNDVILALVTATVRRYCELHGDRVKGRLLRIMVPVNLRGKDCNPGELGNRISLVPVTIPLDIRPLRRLLAAVHRRTEFLKHSHAAELVSLAGGLIGMFPTSVQALAGPIASQLPITPFNLVCTNVPGPQFPLYLRGHKMLQCYPYVPVGGEMAVNCAILSYDGAIYFGFSGDVHAAPDLRRLEKLLRTSFTELRDAVGIQPPQKKRARRAKPQETPKPVPVETVRVSIPLPAIIPSVESKRAPQSAPAIDQEKVQTQITVA